jgi:hypothetical protein
MKRLALALILVLVAASSGAFAQVGTKPVAGYIAGGYAQPFGKTDDVVNPGWIFSGGVVMHEDPKNPFGIRLDFGYAWFWADKKAIESANDSGATVRVDDGYASMFNISADGIYEFGGHGRVGGYFGAGISSYTRYWAATRESIVNGIYCDPWTGWCYPYTTTGDAIVSNDRLTKIGWNAVLALTFPMQSGGEVYIEAAYHWMDSDPATEYLPILLGYRW